MLHSEILESNTCQHNASFRDLDRERSKLEQQEKKVIADIKKMAKEGQMVSLGNAGDPSILSSYSQGNSRLTTRYGAKQGFVSITSGRNITLLEASGNIRV